jgi:membrane protein
MTATARGPATSPTDIPAAGWKRVLVRTKDQVRSDNVTMLAAGIAFYLMLALVPTLAAAVSLYGLIADPADVGEQIEEFGAAMPRDAEQLLEEQLETITSGSSTGLGLGFVVALVIALWSASKGTKAMIDATNAAFDEEETRGFLRLRLLALALTAGGILVVVGALALISIFPRIAGEEGSTGRLIASLVRWPLLAVVMMVALAVLYRIAPDRADPHWQWVSPGAIVATLLWVAGSGLFAIYADRFGNFNETYGSLGAVVVLMLWLFLSGFVVVLGAELNAEAERQGGAVPTS